VLILFHVRELVHQCQGWLENWGCADYDTIMSGYDMPDQSARIAVATMQTYYRRRKKLSHNYQSIIIDEGHHVKANTYQRIFDMMPDAKRLAFTATPIRLDGLGLVDNEYFHDMIESLTPQDLVDKGYLAPIKLFSQPCEVDLSQVRMTAGDYNKKELAEAMESANHGKIMGDAVKYYREYVDGDPALACCASVKHAEMIADLFNKHNIPAVSVSGKTKREDRQRILEQYKVGKIKVMTYCKVFGEGVDLPEATAMFYMQPTASLSNWKQNCGRVSRKPTDDKVAYVFDHVGQAYTTFANEKMGHPYRDIDWKLLIYNQQESKREHPASKTPKIYDRCDDCLSVFDATLENCPECGYNNKAERAKAAIIDQVRGELKEFQRIDQVVEKGLEKLNTLQEYQDYAKTQGYKPGWAWKKYKGQI